MKITIEDYELEHILNDYFRKQYNGNYIKFDFVHTSNNDKFSDEEKLIIFRARCVEQIKVELKSERKINAIKILREFTKLPLAESKAFVEHPEIWEHYIITGHYIIDRQL